MDLTVVYDIQHTMPFGPLVILYLFLAGLSAGLFLLSVFGAVWQWEPMRPLAMPAGIMALATIIPGGLSLLLDLGQPLRAIHLFMTFQTLSVMGAGRRRCIPRFGHVYGRFDRCGSRTPAVEFSGDSAAVSGIRSCRGTKFDQCWASHGACSVSACKFG